MRKYFVTVTILALVAVLAAGCAGVPSPTPTPVPTPPSATTATTSPTPTPTAEWGIIEIRVTDPGVAGVTSAIVSAKNIEIHKEAGEWLKIIDSATFDLVTLATEEKAEILGSANITAGGFTQIRMDVDSVSGLTTDNVSYTAEVPSDKLRIVRPFQVEDSVKTILTLDFDLSKSLIVTGKGKALFKPVVKLSIEKEKVEKSSPPEKKKTSEGKLDLKLEGDAAPGNAVTLLVITSEGKPVEGATVKVNGKNIGQTDKNGTISFTIPEDAKELEIEAKLGELEGELKIKLEGEQKG